ncbi:MAG: PadR family transcriptional regulator [Candidatus Nanoarchaeia archaeon]|nr:PadR family transcriptional regulator [Candidatus Nanoarchaeia archaeon]
MDVKVTTILKLYTLLFLREGDKHGYELMKRLEPKVGKVSTSQIYPFLSQLMKAKLVEVASNGGRDKKVYRLTKEGEKFVDKLCSGFWEMHHVFKKTQGKA